mmetsp:Transcript_9595/g.21642  ORF Transcript_9595/g.21642 Transcript_9595/m.21642 type:complete len:685 (-) Transcript_9595:104-2158(-)|eukprot:CAMPEP_0172305386 /NCGR_PEP_ID=MMETSP1058-20130122/6690_1 /TAXON_ID=83371 /ORGANISM="Detonula confervacea, Strain CCMP 353" /LENGTH=684 /DNA_ID=CAMNT_0013016971 /DNA_START=53 /DNA_END=2107 /DNA_ORIENTATION=-
MKTMKQQQHRLAAYAALYAACVSIQHIYIHAWTPHYFFRRPRLIRSDNAIDARGAQQSQRLAGSAVFSSTKNSESDIIDEDWREFRAQLVRSENDNDVDSSTKRNYSPDRKKDEDHWAYETGDFVERGSIVISVPSSNEFLNDVDALNNICYRKSIVLVLDVGPNFIQGIVLNRPTNIGVKEGMQFVQPGHGEVFEDEMGSCLGDNCEIDDDGTPTTHSARWKVWFGGEVGGPYSDYPQVICLHSVTTDSAMAVSDRVLPGIFVTSFDGAQRIVQAGEANPSDFWLFSGICGWETSTFYKEMHEEGLWHVVSTDSETILEELNMLRCEEEEELAVTQNCDIDHDPRNAGLHTWEMLMEKIDLKKKAHESEDSFGDLMLHEWATSALSFSIKEEQTSMIMEPILGTRFEESDTDFDLSRYDPASAMSIESLSSNQRESPGIVGVMVRASSARRSPYLLSDQGFHKSLILILRDGDDYSEGILLNQMTSRSLRLDLGYETIDLPIRYGGPTYYFADDEDNDDEFEVPTQFLHSNDLLRDAGVGTSIGKSRVFECTKAEVIKVLKSGLASANEIMVVQGLSVWTKKGEQTGILGDVEAGFFELVPRPKGKQVWDALLLQEQLTADNLFTNVSKSRLAWNVANRDEDASETDNSSEKEEIHVFGTDVGVVILADEAAIRWVKVNLLQE